MSERDSLWKFLRRRRRSQIVTPPEERCSRCGYPRTRTACARCLYVEPEDGDSESVECWINGSRFAHTSVKPHMTGAQIRALPLPSIRDSDDLYVEQPGGEDLLVEYDEVVPVAGKRFFSVPRIINAG